MLRRGLVAEKRCVTDQFPVVAVPGDHQLLINGHRRLVDAGRRCTSECVVQLHRRHPGIGAALRGESGLHLGGQLDLGALHRRQPISELLEPHRSSPTRRTLGGCRCGGFRGSGRGRAAAVGEVLRRDYEGLPERFARRAVEDGVERTAISVGQGCGQAVEKTRNTL